MNLIDRPVPANVSTPAAGRPVRGVVLHHTATSADPFPVRGGSWHYLIRKDGSIYSDVSEENVAHHAGATDRWRPSWVAASPLAVSDVNWCTLGLEITYAPQNGEVPNGAQHAALEELLRDFYARYGPLPVVGHGEIDLGKWPTEPHGLQWAQAGLSERGADGHWLVVPPAEEAEDVSDDDKAVLQLVHDLGADFAGVQGWVNKLAHYENVQIPDLERRIQELEGAPQPEPESVIALPQRVEVVHEGGLRFGFVPET